MYLLSGQIDDVNLPGKHHELSIVRHPVGELVLDVVDVFGQHVVEQHHLANGRVMNSQAFINKYSHRTEHHDGISSVLVTM